jgi:hypothetical protein
MTSENDVLDKIEEECRDLKLGVLDVHVHLRTKGIIFY